MRRTLSPFRSDDAETATGRPGPDELPRFALGHVSLHADDPAAAAAWYGDLGTRVVVEFEGMAILELRGGTHIVVNASGAPGHLDLMVDDVDAAHRDMAAAGVTPGPIERRGPHRAFDVTDPFGNRLSVNSSHAMGRV